ncbi:MAG: Re/Si-specific NAD(P)(+) transhydrogenase subunit alpha [Proteobacteria bacterium]|jgi:NAD(P) transhydrogenase subunit alpha|nr:Re/Si-specific NAD(P)(+) transhydrogenase subunit alpha [Pseudomonadota bacterium]
MKIGVPKEVFAGERRVALTPDTAEQFKKLGFSLAIESGAGAEASFSNEKYIAAGVEVVPNAKAVWSTCDIVMKVRPPAPAEIDQMRAGQTVISFLYPAQNKELMDRLAAKKVTVLAMDSVPRISRAQKCDALSSMGNVAGYRAVVEAAQHFGRFFTGQVTAAGKIPPAKVLVIGAGVAGLAAIGAAKGMGAIVRAFDTRPEVREQVQSMGAEFLEVTVKEDGAGVGGYAKVMSKEFIDAEMALFRKQAAEVDIIITTALIPGKPAPKLILADMVETLRAGSVVVDLAAEQGGNCEGTVPGKVVVKNGVTLIGYTDLPSRLATQSSNLYSTNLRHLLTDLTPTKDGVINVNMEDEVIRGATVIKDGEITWPPPAPKLSLAKPAQPAAAPAPAAKAGGHGHGAPSKQSSPGKLAVTLVVAAAVLGGVGYASPPEFLMHFTVFVLAIFVGYMTIWNVTPALHTPLMSVTNAISSIIIIGALLQVSSENRLVWILAAIAITITFVNITGGFAVTQRMLKMFRK